MPTLSSRVIDSLLIFLQSICSDFSHLIVGLFVFLLLRFVNILVIEPMVAYFICKYLLPFSRLYFWFGAFFVNKKKSFSLVYCPICLFCFPFPCYWSQSPKTCNSWSLKAYLPCVLLCIPWFQALLWANVMEILCKQ